MNRAKKLFRLASSAVVLLAAAGTAFAAGSAWKVVSSPNPASTTYVYGTAAMSPSDVWAVGYGYSSSNVQFTLTERWNGKGWSAVPSPNPGTSSNCGAGYSGSALTGVAGISLNDVWSVGYICGYESKTLTEHWNGSKWAVVSSPNEPSGETSTLVAVAAAGTNDVWAVGNYQVFAQYQWNTLVEHWDGARWSIVSSPNVGGADKNFLTAVAAVSSSDIWAVGYTETDITDVPLIEHYDGQSWSIVPSVYPAPSEFNELYGVTALSADDVWAVGYENENSEGQYGGALTEHWDGKSWSLVEAPVLGVATNLYAITGLSSSNVWAVGYVWRIGIQAQPVAEHWDGTSWTAVGVPNPGEAAQLFGAANANGSVWAVGVYSKTGGIPGGLQNPQTLIVHGQ
ncbi:MAG TPA: hypothetical protein VMT20_00265 [Terriglobia bacterium]|nr:hypothetical protein [Terriglobia bacterium]